MLIDSNIIIYAAQPEYSELRRFIAEHAPSVSAISYVEVLGYHRLSDRDRRYFEQFFLIAPLLPISEAVLRQAVEIRQHRRVTLADSIIAGTAMAHGLTLVTRNSDDFRQIQGLSLLNPFDA